jgi:hypothetical protein
MEASRTMTGLAPLGMTLELKWSKAVVDVLLEIRSDLLMAFDTLFTPDIRGTGNGRNLRS